jgi:hypothetical protein
METAAPQAQHEWLVSYESAYPERPGEWFPQQAIHRDGEAAEDAYRKLRDMPDTIIRRVEIAHRDAAVSLEWVPAAVDAPASGADDPAAHREIERLHAQVLGLERELEAARAPKTPADEWDFRTYQGQPVPLNDMHAVSALGALAAKLAGGRDEQGRINLPEPPEWLDLWHEALEATAEAALAEPRTGALVAREPDSEEQGFYVSLVDTNGETLMHSEIHTGHRSPADVAATIREAARFPKIDMQLSGE